MFISMIVGAVLSTGGECIKPITYGMFPTGACIHPVIVFVCHMISEQNSTYNTDAIKKPLELPSLQARVYSNQNIIIRRESGAEA